MCKIIGCEDPLIKISNFWFKEWFFWKVKKEKMIAITAEKSGKLSFITVVWFAKNIFKTMKMKRNIRNGVSAINLGCFIDLSFEKCCR